MLIWIFNYQGARQMGHMDKISGKHLGMVAHSLHFLIALIPSLKDKLLGIPRNDIVLEMI
jgi:hypothetical protein